MGLWVEQSALVELAVHLHQEVADLAQERAADRRIVDEGTATPVGGHRAPQDQLAVARQGILVEQCPPGAGPRQLELRDDRALLDTAAYQSAVAAPAERQAQGVEDD